MLEKGKILKESYQIIEEIGAGGAGVVYKAYHERLQKNVVVKKIKESVKGRLDNRAEADILKNIKHTYLPQVYDFLELDEDVYTVMDYIPGKSMAQVLGENQRLQQKQVLKWAIQLCEALDYLHGQKPPIIHSDIKPANIMLTPQGDICLIDFNISLVFDKSNSQSLGISGGYSPPEQFQSRNSYWTFTSTEQIQSPSEEQTEILREEINTTAVLETNMTEVLPLSQAVVQDQLSRVVAEDCWGKGVTERSDIYSLGATLYHLITGIRPSYEYEKIVPISQCSIEISQGFAYIIEKSMSLNPTERYANASDMLADLKNIVKLDRRYQQLIRKKRRNAAFLILSYCVSFALIVSGAMAWHQERVAQYNRAVEAANTTIEIKKFIVAKDHIEEAFSLFDNRIDAYYEEAFLLFRSGEYTACVAYCKDVINNPKYSVKTEHEQKKLADIWFLAGNAYYEQKDYPNANNCFEGAIEINQKNSDYYRDYAISLVRVGQIEKAEAALEEAKILGLERDSIYMVSGEIAFAQGEFSEAEESLKHAIEAAQTQSLKTKAYKLCAQVYKEMGEAYLEREIFLLEKATANQLTSPLDLLEMLGDAYARKAQFSGEKAYYTKALQCFKQLIEEGYTNYQTMENIAIIQQQLNQLLDAEKTMLEMVQKYPGEYRVYKRLAFLEADKQQSKANINRDYKKASQYYDKANKLYKQRKNDEGSDAEMLMLDNMIREVRRGGWL